MMQGGGGSEDAAGPPAGRSQRRRTEGGFGPDRSPSTRRQRPSPLDVSTSRRGGGLLRHRTETSLTAGRRLSMQRSLSLKGGADEDEQSESEGRGDANALFSPPRRTIMGGGHDGKGLTWNWCMPKTDNMLDPDEDIAEAMSRARAKAFRPLTSNGDFAIASSARAEGARMDFDILSVELAVKQAHMTHSYNPPALAASLARKGGASAHFLLQFAGASGGIGGSGGYAVRDDPKPHVTPHTLKQQLLAQQQAASQAARRAALLKQQPLASSPGGAAAVGAAVAALAAPAPPSPPTPTLGPTGRPPASRRPSSPGSRSALIPLSPRPGTAQTHATSASPPESPPSRAPSYVLVDTPLFAASPRSPIRPTPPPTMRASSPGTSRPSSSYSLAPPNASSPGLPPRSSWGGFGSSMAGPTAAPLPVSPVSPGRASQAPGALPTKEVSERWKTRQASMQAMMQQQQAGLGSVISGLRRGSLSGEPSRLSVNGADPTAAAAALPSRPPSRQQHSESHPLSSYLAAVLQPTEEPAAGVQEQPAPAAEQPDASHTQQASDSPASGSAAGSPPLRPRKKGQHHHKPAAPVEPAPPAPRKVAPKPQPNVRRFIVGGA